MTAREAKARAFASACGITLTQETDGSWTLVEGDDFNLLCCQDRGDGLRSVTLDTVEHYFMDVIYLAPRHFGLDPWDMQNPDDANEWRQRTSAAYQAWTPEAGTLNINTPHGFTGISFPGGASPRRN